MQFAIKYKISPPGISRSGVSVGKGMLLPGPANIIAKRVKIIDPNQLHPSTIIPAPLNLIAFTVRRVLSVTIG